jgi:hypothetical protein
MIPDRVRLARRDPVGLIRAPGLGRGRLQVGKQGGLALEIQPQSRVDERVHDRVCIPQIEIYPVRR